jgi:hypothetical protein
MSEYTGLRFDLYVTSGITQTQFQVIPSYGNAGISSTQTWPAGEWISVELPFSALSGTFDTSSLIMFSVQLWGSTSDSVYLDNIYFYQ